MKKGLLLTAMLLLAAILLSACGQSNEDKYNAAIKQVQNGEYAKAIAAFEALGGYEESGNYITYTKCLEAGFGGRYEAAINTLNTLEDFSEAQLYAQYFTAMAYESEEKYEEAMDVYGKNLQFRDSQAKYNAMTDKINAREYAAAKAIMDSGEYKKAISALEALNGYSDSAALILQCESAMREATIASCKKVGNYVTFGTYPQTKAGTDETPIEWLVLDVQGNKALLISRYGLDAKPFNSYNESITWDNCTLRTWLNDTFLNKAFSASEQKAILTATSENNKSQYFVGYTESGGENTQDRIFVLSYAEANEYFRVTDSNENNTNARVQPTEYAIKNGAYTSSKYNTVDGNPAGYWWLRSRSYYTNSAAMVNNSGSLGGGLVNDERICVRPAFWISLES